MEITYLALCAVVFLFFTLIWNGTNTINRGIQLILAILTAESVIFIINSQKISITFSVIYTVTFFSLGTLWARSDWTNFAIKMLLMSMGIFSIIVVAI